MNDDASDEPDDRRDDGPPDAATLRTVRELLYDMYLDTDVESMSEFRAEKLAGTGVAIEEIERVLVEEVHPVCRSNLWIIPGGVWTGFDIDKLEASIGRRARSPLRFLHRLDPGRFTATRMEEWRATRDLVEAYRAGRQRPLPLA